jgi:CRP-like cAMP-binding protein
VQKLLPVGLEGFLSKLELRSKLDDRDRAAVLSLPFTLKTLRRHDFVVREDEVPRHCCILSSGVAIRHKTAGNGGRQIFSIHMRDDAVDLHNSLLGRADHNIEMLSRGTIICVPVERIRDLGLEHPRVGQAMWYETLLEAAIFREWTLNVGRRDARSRMAHLLCEFALRLEIAGLGASTSYELPMTHEELADALSLTSIHVSRTLKGLADEGLVERTNRAVRILDWHGLVKTGDFNRGYLHLPEES